MGLVRRRHGGLFSCVSVESRVPADHPLRAVRTLLDEVLASMDRDFDRLHAETESFAMSAAFVRPPVFHDLLKSARTEHHAFEGESA